MSCYDSVFVRCPKCGEKVEFQSKAGRCFMDEYFFPQDRGHIPSSIIGDLDGRVEHCRCGCGVTILVDFIISVSLA